MISSKNIRRCPPRFRDGDCPVDVADIFDSKAPGERYTVVYHTLAGDTRDPWVGYRGMSAAPFHPQGVGLYGELRFHEMRAYRDSSRRQRVKWSSLPADVQQCVRNDLCA